MKPGVKLFFVITTMVLFLALAGFVFFSTFGVEGDDIVELTATIGEITGQVEAKINADAANEAAYRGMPLEAGGGVFTGSDGRARIDLSSGTIIRLAENTTFELASLEIADGDPFTRLKVKWGELWVILAGGTLEADTPSGVATVRGSYLSVAVEVDQGTFVTCLEGSCAVETEAGQVEMIAGDTARVSDLSLMPETGFMTKDMILYWIENNPEATKIVPAVTATVRASLPEVVLPDLDCLYGGSCVEYCLPDDWNLQDGKIPALSQIPTDCIEGLFSFVWQGVNPETFFVCLAVGGSPQSCANNAVRRVFPQEVSNDQDSQVVLPELDCQDGRDCASYCAPAGWDANSGQIPELSDIPQDCLQAVNLFLEQDIDPWLFIQCVSIYGDVSGCAEAAFEQ